MKHQYLEFKVIHQQIQRTDSFFVVGGSVNYLKARFTFCEDWDGKEQIAIFTGGGHSYAVSLKDGECFVPWEVLRVKRFYVGCMAGERITSNAVAVDVCPCAVGDNLENPLEPTPTVLDEKIRKAVEAYMEQNPMEGGGVSRSEMEQYVAEAIKASKDSDCDNIPCIYAQLTEPSAAPDGSVWIIPGDNQAQDADKLYIQPEEPVNATDGSVWIVPGGKQGSGVSRAEMEKYVGESITAALAAIPEGEEMLFG